MTKKTILNGIFAIVLVAVAGFGINNMNKGTTLSDLGLANVEALANGETPGIGEPGGKYKFVTLYETGSETIYYNGQYCKITYFDSDCYGDGNLTCPGAGYTLSCGYYA